jgi:phosphatidylglycerol:prolipoprotein diacylglycerol transferase
MLDNLKLDPVAFTLPFGDGFAIYWYGILITIGIALGAIWGAREIERRKQSADEFFNGLLIAILSGYLFARLTYVLFDVIGGNGARYDSFLKVINLREGGVNILGGFVGAAVITLLYLRWRKLGLWHYADVVGPTLLLAQGIGRWGNFVNQELYGPPTTLPWGISIDPPYRLSQYAFLPADTRFHPTFLYESLWLLLGFVVLVVLNNRFRQQWNSGILFGLFLIWWAGGRFFIEFFRPDQVTVGDSWLTWSMLLSVALVALGGWIVLRRSGRIGTTQKRPVKPRPRRTA